MFFLDLYHDEDLCDCKSLWTLVINHEANARDYNEGGFWDRASLYTTIAMALLVRYRDCIQGIS